MLVALTLVCTHTPLRERAHRLDHSSLVTTAAALVLLINGVRVPSPLKHSHSIKAGDAVQCRVSHRGNVAIGRCGD